jgi:hypothetical protein
MVKILFKARDNRGSYWKKSPIMQKLLENPRIRAILNEPGEKSQFFRELEESLGKGNVTNVDMRKAYDDLRKNKGDKITDLELRKIFNEILGSGWERYYSHESDTSGKTSAGALVGKKQETSGKDFSGKIKEMHMQELRRKDAEPESADPHRLQEIADEKVKKEREERFRKKMDDIERQRKEHLHPEVSAGGRQESHNYESLSSLNRRYADAGNDASSRPAGKKSGGMQEKSDELEKEKRENRFKAFMERTRAQGLANKDLKISKSPRGANPPKEDDSDKDNSAVFGSAPRF